MIFPPNKSTVQGNIAILDFMKGGMGKVDVLFEPDNLIVGEKLAFENGTFKDITTDTNELVGLGNYSITWILDETTWKILCHTWSLPNKD